MLADCRGGPDVAFLQEAKVGGSWDIPGYTVHEAGAGFGADHDNCRIAVRDGLEVAARGAWKVPGEPWSYNGKYKPTRVYPWIVVDPGGGPVLCVCVHRVPGGPGAYNTPSKLSWVQEHKSIVSNVAALSTLHGAGRVVIGGDWNTRVGKRPSHTYSLERLAATLGASLHMRGIDGFLVVGDGMDDVRQMGGRYGSDSHHPVAGTVK